MQVITSKHCFLPLKSFHTKRIYRHADCIKVIFPSTLEIIEANNLQLSVEVEQSIVICQWQADHLFAEAENTLFRRYYACADYEKEETCLRNTAIVFSTKIPCHDLRKCRKMAVILCTKLYFSFTVLPMDVRVDMLVSNIWAIEEARMVITYRERE